MAKLLWITLIAMLVVSALFLVPRLSGLVVDNRPTVRIATWNIQNFGQKKARNNATMREIMDIVSDYDIVAIQEISNVDERHDPGCARNANACPGSKCHLIEDALLSRLAAMNYSVVISDQVKDERYAFVFRKDKVQELGPAFVVNDSSQSGARCDAHMEDTGLMVREPFVDTFNVSGWVVTLMTAHTSPLVNVKDLNGLAQFFGKQARQSSNTVLLGDLNADCAYLRSSQQTQLGAFDWLVPSQVDTTVGRSDCTYDQFVIPKSLRSRFAGRTGVDTRVTPDVSDHYLVWADFFVGTA